jgi:hypothetical protein
MVKNSDTYGIFDAYRTVLTEATGQEGLLKTKEEIENAKLRASTITNKPMREQMQKLIADSERALQDADVELPTNSSAPDAVPLSSPEPTPSATKDPALDSILSPLPSSPTSTAPTTTNASAPRNKETIQKELNAAIASKDMGKASKLFDELLPYNQKQKGQEGYKDLGSDKPINLKASPFNPSLQAAQEMGNSQQEPFKMQAPEKQEGGEATQTQPTENKPAASKTSGGSIVDYLAGAGQASDFASRSKLAAQYGISDYKGTAQQNLDLLRKLQSGEKPSTETQQKTTPESGGVSKAIGGAGNAIKKGLIGSEAPLGGALGAISKGIGGAGNIAKGAVGGASKAIGGAGNLVKKGLIGSDKPLGGAVGAVSKGLGSVGNVAKNAGNIAKGAVGGASKAIGGAGNLAKQGLTGQKEPMGGILGGISKGLGSIGNVAKRAVGGKAKEEAEEIKENKNIANFLRSLTDKNYHEANIHLKEIIDNKVRKKLSNSIK